MGLVAQKNLLWIDSTDDKIFHDLTRGLSRNPENLINLFNKHVLSMPGLANGKALQLQVSEGESEELSKKILSCTREKFTIIVQVKEIECTKVRGLFDRGKISLDVMRSLEPVQLPSDPKELDILKKGLVKTLPFVDSSTKKSLGSIEVAVSIQQGLSMEM